MEVAALVADGMVSWISVTVEISDTQKPIKSNTNPDH